MREMWRDARLAVRSLTRDLGFSLPLVLTFALAVGFNSGAFGLASALIFRPLPVDAPEHLVQFVARSVVAGTPSPYPWSYPDFADYRTALQGVVSNMSMVGHMTVTEESGGRASNARALDVSGVFFQVLGVKAIRGRTLLPADDQPPGPAPTAVISKSFWQQELASKPIGGTIRLNDRAFTVVGVVDSQSLFQALGDPQIFIPVHSAALVSHGNRLSSRGSRWGQVFARLAPGVSLSRAQAVLTLESARLAEEHPRTNGTLSVTVVRTSTFAELLGPTRQWSPLVAKLLWVVTSFLLLVAFANCANLSLTRSIRRVHEFAVRLSLGASSARLGQQLLIESLLLCVTGSLLGCSLAIIGLDSLRWFPALAEFRPAFDAHVVAYAATLTMGATLLFGLAPLAFALRAGSAKYLQVRRPAATRGQRGFRHILAACQVALSVALLISTAVMLHSLIDLRKVDLGFDPSRLVTAQLDFSSITGSPFRPPSKDILERLHRDILLLPSVRAVAFSTVAPLDEFDMSADITIPGHTTNPGEARTIEMASVGDGYFHVLGAPIIKGRGFDDLPKGEDAKVLVSSAAAERYWPGRDAVGQDVVVDGRSLEVVGVVRDLRQTVSNSPGPFLYYRYPAEGQAYLDMLVRTTSVPAPGLQAEIMRSVHRIVPGLPEPTVRSMTERLQAALMPQTNITVGIAAFAVLALLLASVGLFSVVSYDVTARYRELAVRMAVGASPSEIFRLVLGRTLRIVLIGMLAAVLLCILSIRALGHFMFGVSEFDPVSFLGAPLFFFLIAVLASAIPARRAAYADPGKVLREE